MKKILLPLLCLLAAVVLLFIPFDVEPHGYLAGVWMDFLHLPFAALVCFAFFSLLSLLNVQTRKVALSSVCALTLLVVAEFIQDITGRSFSFYDLFYDGLGVLSAVIYLQRKFLKRSVVACVGIAILFAGISHPVYASGVVWQMVKDWPVIIDFQRSYEENFIERLGVKSPAPGEFITEGAIPFSSVFIEHPKKDWTGYSSLRLTFRVEEKQVITLRIDDRVQSETYNQRFQYEVEVDAGAHDLCIPLDGGIATSGGRPLDLKTIYRTGIILEGKTAGNKIYLQKLELAESECY